MLDEVETWAEGCGIGTILTQLSMNEDKIHETKNIENVAMDNFKEVSFHAVKKWAKASCSKLIVSEMQKIKGSAEMYFNTAKSSGFSILFIKRETNDVGVCFHRRHLYFARNGLCAVGTSR